MTGQKPDFSNVEGAVNGVPTTRGIPAKGPAVIAALVLAAAMAIIAPWEGTELKPYQDIVGVWTWCTGHTEPGTKPKAEYTPAECDALLASDTGKAYAYVDKCITAPMPVNTLAAFTSAAFNLGPQVVCGSTLQRLANAGDRAGACAQLLRWDKAGGKVVRGLTLRRKAEYKLCLSDDTP